MPYIRPSAREKFAEALELMPAPENAGELNYLFSVLARQYVQDLSSYQAINDVMGAFSGAQAEFYRRFAVPYEDMKRRDNGDFI